MIYPIARRARRRLLNAAGLYRPAPTYQAQFVERAGYHCNIRGQKILVVGANNGEDCRHFIAYGAREVVGLDVVENVGAAFPHPRVRYYRDDIQASKLESASFDLVFSVATMEHVPDIERGFAEMVRLAKPKGFVFSSASPLWESPYGHHMEAFQGHPWIHLAYDRDDLIAYARANAIHGERGVAIEHIVDYMLNPEFFNRRPAPEYIDACRQLKEIDVIQNDLAFDSEALLEHPLAGLALARGAGRTSLLAVTHTLIARKKG